MGDRRAGRRTARRAAARLCLVAAAGSIVAMAGTAAPAAGSPYVHAHRGGPLDGATAEFGENTLPAFQAAADAGFVLELDVKLTSDDVPVVIHDATLDRTTDCAGRVDSMTAAQIRSQCDVDILGTEGNSVQLLAGDPRRAEVPTLAEVLDLAKREGATINLEIKNIPVVDPDFDSGVPPAFAQIVAQVIEDRGFPPSRLIVQSFWPPNLDVIEADPYFATAQTSLLTLANPPAPFNEFGPSFADARGYEWISPEWPIDQAGASTPAYIAEAHALGLQVVPFTLDSAQDVKSATTAGVDAVITNDPGMARQALAEVEPPRAPIPPAPSDKKCAEVRANRTVAPIEAFDPQPDAPRVFAMQFKQELRHIETYETFRTKIECMIREYVVPRLSEQRPNIVAFNEDVGLGTIATGSRGAAARALFEDPETAPSCEEQGVPCGVAAGLAAVRTGYSRELAAYHARFQDLASSPIGASFVAPTDTFARGWMQTFSDMARRYGVYILGSNNQPPFRESRDPSEISTFADPDLPEPPKSVYVATDEKAYNEVFMWGPESVRREGPRPLRNVVAQNKKVPLTSIEETVQISNGPNSGPDAVENLRPYHLPGTEARIGFATSAPAFVYGHDFGIPPPSVDPCSDTSNHYMRCLDALGTNLVMQDEANPGRWAGRGGGGAWQPLEWMASTWRAAADPTVGFAYNVTPHMVGNLADLAFDGQTAITQRGLGGQPGCHYVGNGKFMPEPPENDPERFRAFAGPKTEFIGIAPWVRLDGPRDELRKVGRALAPGSRDPLENDYVETAVAADLSFPPDAERPSCKRPGTGGGEGGGGGPGGGGPGEGGGSPEASPTGACALVQLGLEGPDELDGSRGGDWIGGGRGNDVIRGRRGRDCLLGGPGRDVLIGGRGKDLLLGGPGNDKLRGGPGRDHLRCGRGEDAAAAEHVDRVRRTCERVR